VVCFVCSQNGVGGEERRGAEMAPHFDPTHVFADDEEDAGKSAGGSGSTGIVFHCKGNSLTLLCFKNLVRLGTANMDIHSSGHGITNSTGDAGSFFAPTCLLPNQLESKTLDLRSIWLATRIASLSESLSKLFPHSERSPERNCDRRACAAWWWVSCGVAQKHRAKAENLIHISALESSGRRR